MDIRKASSTFAAVLATAALAGCATSVDWGGPLLHYRYDSRPASVDTPVVVAPPAAVYHDGAVVYRESDATPSVDAAPRTREVLTYRRYGEPVVTYGEPVVIYGYQSPSVPYQDHGQ